VHPTAAEELPSQPGSHRLLTAASHPQLHGIKEDALPAAD
jgi:hypothetical protein